MKEKTVRTIWISASAVAAFLVLTAMVHVYIFFFDYPIRHERVSLILPKAGVFAVALIGLIIAGRRGGGPRRAE